MDETKVKLTRFLVSFLMSDGRMANGILLFPKCQSFLPFKIENFFRLKKIRLVRERLDSSMKISSKEHLEVKRKSALVVKFDGDERLWERSFGE